MLAERPIASDSEIGTSHMNASVSGTLTTADVTTTGNVTISGNIAPGTLGIGDLNITADGTITTDSNGDFVVDPAGTGAIVLTGPITATGTQTTIMFWTAYQCQIPNKKIKGFAFLFERTLYTSLARQNKGHNLG